MFDYCKALLWRTSELFRKLAGQAGFEPPADPRRLDSSACPHCWAQLLGPHGWFRRALSSPQYRLKYHRKYLYERKRTEMEASSSLGCQWCQFALAQPDPYTSRQIAPETIRLVLEITEKEGPSTQTLEITFKAEPSSGSAGGYSGGYGGSSYHFLTAQGDPAAHFISGLSELHDVDSVEARNLAQKCLSQCIQDHERCPRWREDPVLPKRLIDCQDPLRPKLVTFDSDSAVRGKYIALSYVWGEPQPHSTSLQNVSSYHEHIDISSLPQTIRDSISLTHDFGIWYLWIDTLCIIQDSYEDKIQQLSQMANIYSEAYFTIIAASASKVSEGFLQVRSPPPRPDPSFPIWCPKEQQLGTFFLRGNTLYYDDEVRDQVLSPDNDPIHSRGWCLQEMFLSPRALVYTSRTLEYRCQTVAQSVGDTSTDSHRFSAHPKGLHHLLETRQSPPSLQSTLQGGPEWEQFAAGVLSLWHMVLREYSRRTISYPSDKLVAFSGVAERFQTLRKSKYYAGLWEDTLIFDLLWETETERGSYPTEYRAPSWSWAALGNEVKSYYTTALKNMSYCNIVRCDVVFADESVPFGAVRSAELVIEAPLVRVSRGERDLQGDSSFQPGRSRKLFMSREGLDECFHANHLTAVTTSGVHIGTVDFDRRDQVDIADLWALPLMWRTKYEKLPSAIPRGTEYASEEWLNNIGMARGLVLTTAANVLDSDGHRRYRRVGRWSTVAGPGDPTYPTWIDESPVTSVIIV